MFANQDGGCPAESSECRYGTGLLLAVWTDGRILKAESADTIGLRYVMGSTAPEQRDAVLAALGELGQMTIAADAEQAPGIATHHIIVATTGGRARSIRVEIPVTDEQHALVEEKLTSIMGVELQDRRSVHWSELPRFDSPVTGDWRYVRGLQ